MPVNIKCETPHHVGLYVRAGKGGNLIKIGEFRTKRQAVSEMRKLEMNYCLDFVISAAKRKRPSRERIIDNGLTAR